MPDWNSRLELITSLTPPDIKHSKRYQRLLMTAGYYRIKAVLDYKGMPDETLKASATLIRPTEVSLQLGDDYGLSKVIIIISKVKDNFSIHNLIDNNIVEEFLFLIVISCIFLQSFSSPVKVHFVEGNHFTILENKKTSDVITEGTVFHESLVFKKSLSDGQPASLQTK